MKIKVKDGVYCLEPEGKALAKIDFYLMGRIINKGDVFELKENGKFICIEGKLLDTSFSKNLYDLGFKDYFETIKEVYEK